MLRIVGLRFAYAGDEQRDESRRASVRSTSWKGTRGGHALDRVPGTAGSRNAGPAMLIANVRRAPIGTEYGLARLSHDGPEARHATEVVYAVHR
jgi:hypothetical protein